MSKLCKPKKKKARVDQALVERGFFESRERAQRAIMAGEVRMGDRVFTKAAELIEIDAPISIVQQSQFASRGALKLEGALDFLESTLKARPRSISVLRLADSPIACFNAARRRYLRSMLVTANWRGN
jgi:ribosomal 50S subunit-recycling heat shock protein